MTKTTRTPIGFTVGQQVVYPAHGVGIIQELAKEQVAGFDLELLVVTFEATKMTVRIPKAKAASSGLRALSDEPTVAKAVTILSGRAKARRGVWARKASEYDAKIKSGDLLQTAEVLRDLGRTLVDPNVSYSERQLFEAAMARFQQEIAIVRGLLPHEAARMVEDALAQGKPAVAASPDDDEEEAAAA